MKPSILLCLHGWGGSKESFTELRNALAGSPLEILTPDLPGFGSEPEPSHPWTVDDYADWVESWLRSKLPADRLPLTVVLGHSHGGRIAIKLAARGTLPIEHLFLVAAAGIPEKKNLKHVLGLLLAKGGKLLLSIPGLSKMQPAGKKLLYRLLRVHDYEVASPVMRTTHQNVTAEDLRPELAKISIPTDIFWGTEDTMTPFTNGKEMHRLIRGSKLHIFEGVRHRIHRDRAGEIATVIRQFLPS
ncbi:MAG: alpha/beta hydrolase [Candidatus Peribacteraceae bacterium]